MSTFPKTFSASVLLLIAAASLTACGSKTSNSGSATAATVKGDDSISIQALTQIDSAGKPIAVSAIGKPMSPAGDGKATCSNISIATMGPLTGDGSALGLNVKRGADLAIKEHNDANPGCQVTLKAYDDEGDPQRGTQVAPQVISTQTNIGVVGPVYSGVTKAVGPQFQQSNMLLLAIATNPALSKNGWGNFFRGVANDSVQGPAVAKWISGEKGLRSICVVSDNTDYGIGLAKEVKTTLGAAANPACSSDQIKRGDKDFSALAAKVKSAKPDAVYFGGYYAEAALILKQLRTNGVKATFISDDAANDPEFTKAAGKDAIGALLSCPCGPASLAFTAAYTKLNGSAPASYSVEGYDYTTILLRGIDSGIKDRAKMIDYLKTYDAPGVGRNYKWNDNGELVASAIWAYEVK